MEYNLENCVDIGLIHGFEVVNIRRGPKNGLRPECTASANVKDRENVN